MVTMRTAIRKHEAGFILVSILILLLLFTAAGMGSFYAARAGIKSTGYLREKTIDYYQAEGGAISVLAYMTDTKRLDAPHEVKHSDFFDAEISILGGSTRIPAGYSVNAVKGADVLAESSSKNNKSVIDIVAFVPAAKAGYGNE